MSTTSQYMPQTAVPQVDDLRVGIVAAEWNAHINDHMAQEARQLLEEHGAEVDTFHVPGAVELTFAASNLIESSRYDAVIVFGTVIRGGTPHFDYVCQSVTQGITMLNADRDIPVIFGVLTVDRESDAVERAHGPVGHKGAECAEAAIKMVAFKRQLDDM